MRKSKNSSLPRMRSKSDPYIGKIVDKASIQVNETIWVFWGGAMPEYISLCLETINAHRGSFDFVVVSPETITHYLPDLPKEWSTSLTMWAQKSDIFSAAILQKYGGIALDADVVVLKDLSEVFSRYMKSEDFYVFLNAEHTPSVGYMMARAESGLISDYYKRQIEILLSEDDFDNKFILFGSKLLSAVIKDYAHCSFDLMLGTTALFYWKSWSAFMQPLQLSDYIPNLPEGGSSLFLVQLYNHNLSKDSLSEKNRNEILASETLLADCFERSFDDFSVPERCDLPWESNVTFVVKTFVRPALCVEAVRKIRDKFPNSPIIVCDDGNDGVIPSRIKGMRISYLTMPFDSGLSAGRNYLLKHVSTKYFFLSDDDAILEDSSTVKEAYELLEQRQRLDVVSGYEECSERELIRYSLVKRGDIIFHYRAPYGYLGLFNRIPLYHMVENVFLARTSTFEEMNVFWDEELKVSEHLEFFYRYRNDLNITFLPDMKFLQIQTTLNSMNYDQYRNRSQEFWGYAKDKMSIVNTDFAEYTLFEKILNKLRFL